MRIRLIPLLYLAIIISLTGCGKDYKWDTNNTSALEGKYETRDKSLDINITEQNRIAKSISLRFLYANRGAAGISVSIMRDDHSTFNFAYGCLKLKADIEESGVLTYDTGDQENCELPLLTTSRMKLGSLTKTTVARTILDIDDSSQYNFNINDLVTKHLAEDILSLGDLSGITIKHLLYHTSGLSTKLVPGKTVQETIKTALDDKKIGTPGQYYKYNNIGYIILGQVIKHVTNSDTWEGEIQKRLDESLGENSFIFPEASNDNWIQTEDTSWLHGVAGTLVEGNQSLATGYLFSDNFTSVLELSGADIANSAGSLIGNVPDVTRWMHNLVTNEGGLLSQSYFQNIILDGVYVDDYISHLTWNMGAGLGLEQVQNAFFHLGSITGYSCNSVYSKNEKITISMCVNGSAVLADLPYELLSEMYPYRKAYIPESSHN